MLSLITGILLFSFSFANVIEAPAPFVDFQQNPTEIDWKKIDTEHFEVIFPVEVTSEAQRVAHLLETAYPLVSRSLQIHPKRIPIILQNQSTISNGFVTLAPRRSEWYMTPVIEPDLGTTEWMKTLAVHEFRHVVQFQKSRQGFNRVWEVFLGEIGQALGIGLSTPPWYLEGDAVGVETALTKGGRGRIPQFERDLRTLLLSGYDFNYDKAHLGSFDDYIPNHYVYGYFYTTFMRNKHGELFLSQLTDKATDRSYNPLTFYNAYENLTGVDFEDFYRQTMKELIKNWKEKQSKLNLTPYKVKNSDHGKDWVNYLYPQALNDGKILAFKKGLSYIDQFVLVDGKEETTLFYPSYMMSEYPFKVRGGKLAFVEWEVDPRWGYRDYSRVRVYDIDKDVFVADFRETKGRMAVLNHTADQVLYVEWLPEQGQMITVRKLDGTAVSNHGYPADRVITSIDWLDDTKVVIVYKDHSDQKKIERFDLSSNDRVELYDGKHSNLGFVTTYKERILVESPVSGIDNIFELKDGKLEQITSSKFGAYAPSVHAGKLIYNDYSAKGMNIAEKTLPWDEKQESSDSFVPYYEKIAEAELKAGNMEKDFFKQENFPVKDYSQLKKSLNLHSWVILAPPLTSVVTVMGISRDVLNKFFLMAGANWDLNEKEAQGFVSASWSHLYPVFDIRAAYGGRNQNITIDGNEYEDDHWEEGTFEAGMSVPWQRLTGRFTQSFSVRPFAKLIKVTNKRTDDNSEVSDGALFSPGATIQYSFLSRLARRDLNPEWGLALLSHMEDGDDISGKDMSGSVMTVDGRAFLPGLMKHHSFFHQLAYEKQEDESYQYSSLVLKPRGTKNVFLEESYKYSANYMLPLFYPDWNMSRYLYFKRISLNLFYDEMNGYYRGFDYYAASTGWETLFDVNFFRIFIPFTLGVRGNYVLHGEEKHNYEFFITTIGGYF